MLRILHKRPAPSPPRPCSLLPMVATIVDEQTSVITGRQTDRQHIGTHTHRDSQTARLIDRQTERERGRQRDRGETERQTDRQDGKGQYFKASHIAR